MVCYRLNVFFPPKFTCQNLISNVMVLGGGTLGRSLDNELRALMNGISVLIKESLESSLAPCTMCGCREKTTICLRTRKQSLTRQQIC